MEEEKMLNVGDVAKLLQINRMTIYKLAKSGKLPGIRVGNEWRFNKEELQKWLSINSEIEKTPSKISARKHKGKVLIVDDDAGIRDLFVKILKDEGYALYTASSGEKCIELIKRYNPHVVLLDLKMAGIDGVDTLCLIKKYDKKIMVIIVTAYATMNTAIEAMKIGAYDYIAKPFDNEKIISLVKKTVKIAKGN